MGEGILREHYNLCDLAHAIEDEGDDAEKKDDQGDDLECLGVIMIREYVDDGGDDGGRCDYSVPLPREVPVRGLSDGAGWDEVGGRRT